jgi:hypothetical protein
MFPTEQFIGSGELSLTMPSTTGSMMMSRKYRALVELGSLSWKTVCTRYSEERWRKPVSISRGSSTITVIQLKMSCRMAAVKHSRYSSFCLMWYSAMMVEVRLVPMLVPITTGMP